MKTFTVGSLYCYFLYTLFNSLIVNFVFSKSPSRLSEIRDFPFFLARAIVILTLSGGKRFLATCQNVVIILLLQKKKKLTYLTTDIIRS